jgi:hypothetical protein
VFNNDGRQLQRLRIETKRTTQIVVDSVDDQLIVLQRDVSDYRHMSLRVSIYSAAFSQWPT